MLKKIVVLIFTVFVALSSVVPVLAKEDRQAAPLSLEYKFVGEQGSGLVYAEVPMTKDILDTVDSIFVWYSLDGKEFLPLQDSYGDIDIMNNGSIRNEVFRSVCLLPMQDPLKAFIAGDIDRFWLKLYIEGGVYEGFTTAAVLEYNTTPKPLPEQYGAETLFPKGTVTITMDKNGELLYTATQKVTLPQGRSAADALASLPAHLPMTVQVLKTASSEFAAKTTVPFAAKWKLPDNLSELLPGEYVFRQENILLPPAEASARIGSNTYTFAPPQPGTNQFLNLVVTITPSDQPPVVETPSKTEDPDGGSGGNRGNAGNNSQGDGGVRPGQPVEQSANPESLTKPEHPAQDNKTTIESTASGAASLPDDSASEEETAAQKPTQSEPENIPAAVNPRTSDAQPNRKQPFNRTGILLAISAIAVAILAGVAVKTGLLKKLTAKFKRHSRHS